MTEDDGRLTRKYRELAGEEPSAAMDAAILAASRRAVKSRPASQRWAGPVSIAAVLVLAVGVVINVQHEQPGIETSEPARRVTVPEAPRKPEAASQDSKEMAATVTATAPQSAPDPASTRSTASAPPPLQAPKVRAEKSLRKDAAAPSPKREEIRLQMAPAAPAASAPVPAADAFRAEPKPFAQSNIAGAAASAPSPILIPSERAAASPAAPVPPAAAQSAPSGTVASAARPTPELRAKREMSDSVTSAQKTAGIAINDPAAELERIARLRSDGRNEDADKALAEFRRRYPDYRIPDPVWERVKPR